MSDEVVIEVMANETWLGKLKDKIITKEPTTFSEVMAMTTKLIKMDEDRRLWCEDDKMPSKIKKRSEPRRPRPQHPYFRSPAGSPASRFRKEIENYTSLNAPKSQVLM